MSLFKKFPKVFWVANTMELFERWAWYGVFSVLAIYLTGSTDEGALGFSHTQKGNIIGIVTMILYALPIFTGTIADKFGYKKILLLSFSILSSGYFFMGMVTDYSPMFWIFTYVAVGAALFKPVISATIAKSTKPETASVGFGIFYMMVNVGGFVGPFIASSLRNESWDYVFWMATAAIALNFIIVLFFYKEPNRTESNDESFGTAIGNAFKNIITVLSDWKYSLFLVILVGFWTMFNQLFYTLPNFIEQWIDTGELLTDFKSIFGTAANIFDNGKGEINPEMLINFDAGAIVLFQVLVSAAIMRMKPLNAMMGGILVATLGVCLAFATQSGFFVWLAIILFAFGEMSSSPKSTEYIGRIAPADKAALYMGTSFLPVAVGNYFAGIISGSVYEEVSDKYTLLKTEIARRGLSIPEVTDKFTLNNYYAEASKAMGMSESEMTTFIWNNYSPDRIWNYFAIIGISSVVGLLLYDKFILGKTETAKETTNEELN